MQKKVDMWKNGRKIIATKSYKFVCLKQEKKEKENKKIERRPPPSRYGWAHWNLELAGLSHEGVRHPELAKVPYWCCAEVSSRLLSAAATVPPAGVSAAPWSERTPGRPATPLLRSCASTQRKHDGKGKGNRGRKIGGEGGRRTRERGRRTACESASGNSYWANAVDRRERCARSTAKSASGSVPCWRKRSKDGKRRWLGTGVVNHFNF